VDVSLASEAALRRAQLAGDVEAGRSKGIDSARFENFDDEWRARETYEVRSPGEFVEIFELAAPGKEFEVYSRNHFKRAKRG
jgi:hypothetical protein